MKNTRGVVEGKKLSLMQEIAAEGSTPTREVVAGFSTFATMVYILIVQPLILGACGMPQDAVFTVTAICTILSTVTMAVWAKLPFALSTAMGTNAIFAYSIVLPGLATWQEALGMIFWSGIIFMVISFTPARAKVVEHIPRGIKDGLAPAIGIFLLMLGFGSSGMSLAGVVDGSFVFADMKNPAAIAGMVCLIVTLFIYFYQRHRPNGVLRVPGAVLIGIFLTTVVFMVGGFAAAPTGVFALPPNPLPVIGQVDLLGALRPENWVFILIFFLGDFFSTAGTVLACGRKAGFIDQKTGEMPGMDQAFKVDSLWTVIGSWLGCSTITTFVESAAGVESGGRTRLTSLSTAGFFLIALFFSPIFLSIPAAASGVALIVVGFSMFLPIFEMDKVDDVADAAEEQPNGPLARYSDLDKVPVIATVVLTPIVNDFATALCVGLLLYGVFQIAFWLFDKALKLRTPKIAVPSVMTFVLLLLAIVKLTVTIS
jgi:AGZA family xanthine/uracil permease-like MFS transporter